MHNLIRPKFFIPVHGELHHLHAHARLAEELGMAKERIFIGENGFIFEFTRDRGKIVGRLMNAGAVMVDGLGVGDVGNIVLRDRRQLSQDGILIVVITISRETGKLIAGPDIVSRGFVYVREAEELMVEARNRVYQSIKRCLEEKNYDWATLKVTVKDALDKYLFEQTRRRPMILPIITEC